MADLGVDIRSTILASTAITSVFSGSTQVGAIEQGVIPENAPQPRLWYVRDRENEELDCSNVGGLTESEWTFEIHSDDDDEVFNIARKIKSELHGHIGTFGSRKVKSVKIEDHDDDYIPRGDASEDGLFVAALKVTIWHTTT